MQEKQVLLQQLNERFQYLQQKVKLLEHQLGELRDVKASVENVSSEDMLFPLGAGVFIRGKKMEENLLMNVGRNVLVEKDPSEVLDTVNHQISRLEEVSGNINEELGELVSQIQMLQIELQNA